MEEYSQWMNNNLYGAAAFLKQSNLIKNRGTFFDSILGTLNYVLVGDTIWLKNFSEHEVYFSSLDYVRAIESLHCKCYKNI